MSFALPPNLIGRTPEPEIPEPVIEEPIPQEIVEEKIEEPVEPVEEPIVPQEEIPEDAPVTSLIERYNEKVKLERKAWEKEKKELMEFHKKEIQELKKLIHQAIYDDERPEK